MDDVHLHFETTIISESARGHPPREGVDMLGDADGLQRSLAGMGFTELAVAFTGFTGYALALNGALTARTRGRAAAAAGCAAVAFCAMTDPWVHGVIFVALAVAAMGLFVGAAWGISALCGFGARERPVLETPSTFVEDYEDEPIAAPVAIRATVPVQPIHSG
ncbi:MAG TPA: hypothetical protein VMU47_13255 [Caldimonas sp.]|nr:hypothetical protein [Caldimonas sp.]